jgi:hypothetical protein
MIAGSAGDAVLVRLGWAVSGAWRSGDDLKVETTSPLALIALMLSLF